MDYTLNCNGRMLYLDEPIVMGILNATPDSFYTQGRYFSDKGLLDMAEMMLSDGARILDVGGMSTRPGAVAVSEEEEMSRVIPAINNIKKAFPKAFISIDTYRADVARAAVEAGADIVNDISAGAMDSQLLVTVAALNVPYILMHMQATPQDMQVSPFYDDVTQTVFDFCKYKIAECRALGIKDIVLDPGFGFGKTLVHNYQLLKGMHTLNVFDVPILAGVSRKSMLYNLLDITPEESLNATTIANLLSLQQGAAILRVHDVKEAVEAVKMWEFYKCL